MGIDLRFHKGRVSTLPLILNHLIDLKPRLKGQMRRLFNISTRTGLWVLPAALSPYLLLSSRLAYPTPYPTLLQPRDWAKLPFLPLLFASLSSRFDCIGSFLPFWHLGLPTFPSPLFSHGLALGYVHSAVVSNPFKTHVPGSS